MNRVIYHCKHCGGQALFRITRVGSFRWVCQDCQAPYKVTVRSMCTFGSELNLCSPDKYRCGCCGQIYCSNHGRRRLGYCQDCLYDEDYSLMDDIELHLLIDPEFGGELGYMWEI